MAGGRQTRRSRSGEYAAIYRFMTEGMGLKGSCLLVYSRIFSFCKFRDGTFYESKRSMGAFLGLSERQVHRAFVRLLERGLIVEVGERVNESRKITKRYALNEAAVSEAVERTNRAHRRGNEG